jgi:hypothetical protein
MPATKPARYKIGQIVWTPDLGPTVVLGVRSRKEYRLNLLVADRHDDRYWIDSDWIREYPHTERQRLSAVAERFKRLVTHQVACDQN